MARSPDMRRIRAPYKPSHQGWRFHTSPARIRILAWGVRSGKTICGAWETLRGMLAMPGTLSWAIAPSFRLVNIAQTEMVNVSRAVGVLSHYREHKREVHLTNGSMISFQSAEDPNALRAATVTGVIWFEEAAFAKAEAWWVVRARGATTDADIIISTSPEGKNWVYREALLAGMPSDAPHGEFFSADQERFISHHPTWEFPWVPEREITEARRTLARAAFERDFGAMFIGGEAQTFRSVADCLSREILKKPMEVKTALGLDLAKMRDHSAAVVVDATGRVHHLDRWRRESWSVQLERIDRLAREWNSTIVIDASNVGSRIEEELRQRNLPVHPVNMHDAKVRNDLIESLQQAFEMRALKLPDPSAPWAPAASKQLLDELEAFETKLTKRGGRITYGVPQNFSDDMAVALALANWGRLRGLAGQASSVADVVVTRDKLDEAGARLRAGRLQRPRLRTPGRVFGPGRRSVAGFESSGERFWGG